MEIALILVAVVVILISVVIHSGKRDAWRTTLSQVAARRGLVVDSEGRKRHCARGVADGVPFVLDTFEESTSDTSTVYTRVTVTTGLPKGTRIRREGVGTSLKRIFTGEDIFVGDERFDAQLHVIAHDPAALVAQLDAPARAALLAAFLDHKGKVDDDQLVLVRRGYLSARDADALIDSALAYGRALRGSGAPMVDRLERVAFTDPVPGVRIRAFELLLSRLATGDAIEAARRALALDDPQLVVRAAGVLRDPASIAALRGLIEVPRPATGAVAAALDLLTELGVTPDPGRVLGFLDSGDPQVQIAAARCLGAIGGAEVRARLVRLLSADVALAVAAAGALGRCGELSEVEALLDHTKGMFVDTELKRAARRAVEAIQSRAGGDPGQLSLAEPVTDGHLALTVDGEEVAE